MNIESNVLSKIKEDVLKEHSRELEEKYKTLVDAMNEGLIQVDNDDRVQFVNNRLCEMLCFTPEELIGKIGFKTIIPPEDQKIIIDKNHSRLDGSSDKYSIRMQKKSGEIIWVEISGAPIKNKLGQTVGSLGIITDITKRKESEERLIESESLLKAIIESTGDGILVVDNQSKVTHFNTKFTEMWRISDELIQLKDDEKLLGFVLDQLEEPEQFLKKVKELYKSEAASYDILKFKDGRYFGRISHPLFIDGKIAGRVWGFGDITEQKIAEERLKESEEKFRNLVENIPIGIYRTTPDGEILMSNQALIDMLGYSSLDDLQSFNAESVSYETKSERQVFLDMIEKKGEIRNFESKWHKKDGSIIYVNEYSKGGRDDDGAIIFYDGIIENITERKKSEFALKESERRLAELNATKDKFFSIIAHDLLNPIGSFTKLISLLNKEYDHFTTEDIKDILDKIDISSNHVYNLLDNLLIWSRSQRNKLEFHPVLIDLGFITENIVSSLKLNSDMKGIALSSSIAKETMLMMDANMVTTVMRNLVSNAIKFTHPGGKVIINTENSNGNCLVTVTDTGVGIPTDRIDRLFRIDVSFTTLGTNNEKGTGLGLILCKEFIERHGGKIWVESEFGKGSTFKFTVPAKV